MFRTLTRALVLVLLAASPVVAQEVMVGHFQTGRYYAGPRLWLGNLNGALAIGGQLERGFTEPGAYGPGIVSGGVGVDFYRWSQNYANVGSYHYSVVPVQAFGNYHFVLQSHRKFDPYVGLALVYSMVNASWSGSGGESAGAGSGMDFAGQAGLRYFLSDDVALQGQLGFGYGALGLGASWSF